MPYAEGTTVSPEKSLAEIQQTLKRYGSSKFGLLDEGDRLAIMFEMKGRRVKFAVPMPPVADFKFDGAKRARSQAQQLSAQYKEHSRRYRALLLVIKSKLESVESGIESFDEAFMGHLVLPSGQTMHEWAGPQIQRVYETGQMPPLMITSGER